MYIRHLICVGTVFVGAMYFGAIAQAQVTNLLILTENSSFSLTATLNGSPVSVFLTGKDLWYVDVGGLNSSSVIGWTEPSNPLTYNGVQSQGNLIFVQSDLPGTGINPNGATDITHFSFASGAPLDVTYIDNGDIPEPHTGAILWFGLTSAFFCRRVLCRGKNADEPVECLPDPHPQNAE